MIEWIFSGIGLTLISAICPIYLFFSNRKKKNIIRDIENEIHDIEDSKKRLKFAIKKYNLYVPTNISFYNNYTEEKIYVANKLKKELKYDKIPPKLNVILGDAGSGKSILMTYFCYNYCRYHSFQKKEKCISLHDRGVVYVRLLHYCNMEQLMNKLNFEFMNTSNINLLILDGADEFREINNKSLEELLIDIFESLENENIINHLKQIYITSRKELFLYVDNVDSFIHNLAFRGNYPRVGEITALSPKQILKIYTKLGSKKNKYKLKKLVYNNQHTIFEIPFFIQYADVILNEKESYNIKKEDALFLVIKNTIENEWKKYWGKYSRKYKIQSQNNIYLHYNKLAFIYLNLFSNSLILNNEYELTLNHMENIALKLKNYNMFDTSLYLLTRNLIHKTNNKYSFVHFSFYEFITSKTLIENLSIPFEKRKKILLNQNNVQIRSIYIYHLDNIINSKNIFYYIISNEEKETLQKLKKFNTYDLYQEKILNLTDYDIRNISIILQILPNIEELLYYQYHLDVNCINRIRNSMYLILNDNKEHINKVNTLKYIENFGELELIDLGDMKINDEDIKNLSKINLKVLKILVNIQEEITISNLVKLNNIKEIHFKDPKVKPEVVMYIYKLWKKGQKVQFYFDVEALYQADCIYIHNNFDKQTKFTILKTMYILFVENIFIESTDEYAFIDVGDYLVSSLIDNKNFIEAKNLAEILIDKESDESIRKTCIIRFPNEKDFKGYPKYAHFDLIFSLGIIHIKNLEYNTAYDLFERGILLVHKIFGEQFMLRGSYTSLSESSSQHFDFLYGMAASLIDKHNIAIQYLRKTERGTVFKEYLGFCSRFFLAKSFCGLNDLNSAKDMLKKCNSKFLMENKYFHQNFNVEISITLDKIINDNKKIYKDIEISYISKILYGKVLALMFKKYDMATEYFFQGIEEMSTLYGAEDIRVIEEKENIKLFLNKDLVWVDYEE